MPTKNLTLTGLNCGACAKVCEMKIKKINGIESVQITQQGNEGLGSVSASREIAQSEIEQALADTHYKVKQYN